jgi:hypothetical protein
MGWCWVEQTLKNECPLRVCSHMQSIYKHVTPSPLEGKSSGNVDLWNLMDISSQKSWSHGVPKQHFKDDPVDPWATEFPVASQPSRPFFAAQHGIATVRPMSRNLRWAATHSSRCVEDSTCWQQFWISKRPCDAKGFLRAFQIFRHNQFLFHNHLKQWDLEIFHSGEATRTTQPPQTFRPAAQKR